MCYAVIGILVGLAAALASLSAGAGVVTAIAVFWGAGVLCLVAGLALAAICVLRSEARSTRTGQDLLKS